MAALADELRARTDDLHPVEMLVVELTNGDGGSFVWGEGSRATAAVERIQAVGLQANARQPRSASAYERPRPAGMAQRHHAPTFHALR